MYSVSNFDDIPIGAIWRRRHYNTYYLKFRHSHQNQRGIQEMTSFTLRGNSVDSLRLASSLEKVWSHVGGSFTVYKTLEEHDLRPKELLDSLAELGVANFAGVKEILESVNGLEIPLL